MYVISHSQVINMGMNPRLADEILKNMDLDDDKNILFQRVVN